MYFVICVVDDPGKIEKLMDAWEKVGITGATILYSSGMYRVRQGAMRDDFPLIPSLESLYQHEEQYHRTIFSIVPNQEMVDNMVNATQSVIGNLSKPNTGVLVVLPVAQAYGLKKEG